MKDEQARHNIAKKLAAAVNNAVHLRTSKAQDFEGVVDAIVNAAVKEMKDRETTGQLEC